MKPSLLELDTARSVRVNPLIKYSAVLNDLNASARNFNIIHCKDSTHMDELLLSIRNIKNIGNVIEKTQTNKSVAIANYKIYRCDRISRSSDQNKGGGVAIYVSNRFKSKIVMKHNNIILLKYSSKHSCS